MNSQQYKDYFIEAGKIAEGAFNLNWDGVTNTDWTDVAFENSSMMRHNLTFQGGNESGALYLSLSSLDNDGMVVGNSDTYKRLTGMINDSWKMKSCIEVV